MATPPIITPAPSPPSSPGIQQPVFGSGSATSPAPPINITGSPIIPTSTPPGGVGQIGIPVGVPIFPPTGSNTAPVAVPIGPRVGPAVGPAPVPPSIPGVQQPQFATGSGTTPTAASLFPQFTTNGPQQPIVLTSIFKIGTVPPALPKTPGVAPIVLSQNWGPRPQPPVGMPVNTAPPTISGTLASGSNLSVTQGTWVHSPTTFAFQWLRDGSPIAGADETMYHLTPEDEDELISCIITAINSVGEGSAEAEAVGPIQPPGSSPPVIPPQTQTLGERLHLPGAAGARARNKPSRKKR